MSLGAVQVVTLAFRPLYQLFVEPISYFTELEQKFMTLILRVLLSIVL